MSSIATKTSGRTGRAGRTGQRTFARGVHPPGHKGPAADASIEVMPPPGELAIPLLQHLGAPCEAVVKPKQEVAAGEMLGKATSFISAPVHSPIAGAAQRASVATLPNGRHVKTIPVKAAGEQLSGRALWNDVLGGEWPADLDQYDAERILQAVQEAGIVGQGGAAFPTHVKLTLNENKPIDTIVVNGCECEPYLTADYRLMLEAPQPIIVGSRLAARAVRAKRIVVAIEDNKPLAIDAMRLAAGKSNVEVVPLKTKYPMGGERQTILASLGRKVPTGGLPLDVGVVVLNVGTAAAVARAVVRGKALTHRVVTVSGAGIVKPKNLLVPVGITYSELIDHCGGLTPDAARVLAGGPMMGFALGVMKTPVTKGTSGVTVLTHADVARAAETACVRCGRCVDVCPLGLVPTKIALASKHKDWDLARRYHIQACVECGCCAYACPSAIPLVQLMRTGKAELPRE